MISQSLLEAKLAVQKLPELFTGSDTCAITILKLLSLVESELNHAEYSKRESNARHDVYADVCNKLLKTLCDIASNNKYD